MLKIPDHQVAGHQALGGNLGPQIDDSGHFYKPLQDHGRGSSELSFYTSFSSNAEVPDHIARFFPEFYGTLLVESSDGSGIRPHLVLQDLTFGRPNPSVADIKIGSRTWAPQASEDYIEKCFKRDRETTSLSFGFRLSGMQVFESKQSGFWKPARNKVQTLSVDELRLYLKKFVSSNTSKESDEQPDCAFASTVYGGSTGILSQLLELKAWFEDQSIYHFYTSSVLMMFEKELASNGKNERPQIKLVDFAHVYEGNGVIDHNFLGGLCSFIKFISEIVAGIEETAAGGSSSSKINLSSCCNIL